MVKYLQTRRKQDLTDELVIILRYAVPNVQGSSLGLFVDSTEKSFKC